MKVLVQPPSTDGRGEIDKSVSKVAVGPTIRAKSKTRKVGDLQHEYIPVNKRRFKNKIVLI
jgi:hypothetical protein